jgi:thiol-disulfide isomerase/thioredoxin
MDGLLVATAYIIGVSVPLAAVALVGRSALRRVSPSGAVRLRQGFGIAMVVVSLAVVTGLDVRFQGAVAGLPGSVLAAAGDGAPSAPAAIPLPPLDDLGPAPELAGITAWINSDPTTVAALRGKVVLVHFWTFACSNCRAVQPYVKAWWERYADDGFVVLGIHTPELSFERELANVREAVIDAGVTFPVAFDPDFATWRAYENGAWPAFHFIDRQGHIRYRYGGEGGYATTEAVIQALLAEPA